MVTVLEKPTRTVPKRTRIVVYVSDELKDWLDKNAKSQNRTVSNLVQTLLLEYKSREEKTDSN